jgi:hypothetical protein
VPRAHLHGVLLDWTCEGTADLVAELGMHEGLGAEGGRGEIAIAMREAASSAREDPALEGHAPVFFHGIVQAYRAGGGGFLLWDRASRVFVSAGGSRIEALVAPSDREVVRGSARAALEIALSLALREKGLFHLHAAAVTNAAGKGVLVVGGSGAGKTTATLALVESGWAFLGDDALLVTEGPLLCAFPRPFHIGPATLAAFPRLGPLAGQTTGHGDKRDLDPRIAFPDRRKATMGPPRVVLHPRVEPDEKTALSPIAPAEGLGNLIASSAGIVIDGVARREEQMALIGKIAAGARHFELRMGRDLLGEPGRLGEAVAGLLA